MHTAKSLDRLSLNFSPYCSHRNSCSTPARWCCRLRYGEWNFSPFNRIEDEMRDSASRQVDWDYKKHIMCTLERYKNVFFSFFFFSCGFHCQNREKICAVRRTVRDLNVRHILTLNSSLFSHFAASTTTYSNDLVIFSLWKWHFQDLTRHLLPPRPQSSRLDLITFFSWLPSSAITNVPQQMCCSVDDSIIITHYDT